MHSHLLSKGLFVEAQRGTCELNDAARQLLEPSGQFLDLAGIGGRMAYAWGTLPNFVRTGKSAYHEQYGCRSGRISPRTRRSGRASTR